MDNKIRCEPDSSTGRVSLYVEIHEAKGIRQAYETAEKMVKELKDKEFANGRLDWAEKRLKDKRMVLVS